MDAEIKEKWLKALRSGKYIQGRGHLYNQLTHSYCCLGVLCEVIGADFSIDGRRPIRYSINLATNNEALALSEATLNSISLDDDSQQTLITKNDGFEESFEQIANYIEENL